MKLNFNRDNIESSRTGSPQTWGSKICQDWLTLMDEVERLQPIVDRLAKTADGVPIVPDTAVYYLNPWIDGAPSVERFYVARMGVKTLVDHLGNPIEACKTYSTQAIAEVAGRKEPSSERPE